MFSDRPSSVAGILRQRLNWPALFAAGVLFQFVGFLATLIVPLRGLDLLRVYYFAFIAALTAAYLGKEGFPRSWELRCYLLYWIWLLISRWLIRDVYLFNNYGLVVWAMFSFPLMAAGTLLDAPQRRRFMDWLTLLYGAFFLLVACAGLFVAVTDTYIHIPPENVWITIRKDVVNGLNALSIYRLTTAPRFYLAWCLFAYQFLRTKKLGWRILLVLFMLILHFGISICFSRTVRICYSFGIALLVFLLLYRRFSLRPMLVRVGVPLLLCLLSLPIAYKSFDLCTDAVSGLRTRIAPRFEAAYTASAHQLDPDYFGIVIKETEEAASASQQDTFVETRDISTNTTLTGRTDIWKSTIPAIREAPSILWRGQSNNTCMDIPNKYIPSTQFKPTMHNLYLDVLIRTGLPGFLLCVAWALFLIWKIVRMFFALDRNIPLSVACLSIPLAAFLLFNMVEVLIFSVHDICSQLFFLLVGVFLGEYELYFPARTAPRPAAEPIAEAADASAE